MKKIITLFVLGMSLVTAGYSLAGQANNPIAIKFKDKNGKDVVYYRSDVLEAKRNFPIEEIRKAPDDAVYDKVRDQILIDLLLAEEIEAANLKDDEEVKEAKAELIKQAEKVAEQKIWFKRKIDEGIKEEDLLKKYKKLQQNLKNKKMYNIAVIVVDDKAKADEVLKQALTGKDFSELAKKYSTEPTTRQRGGELGYLHELEIQQALGKDVAKRLKVLKDGVCSNKPIEKGGKQFILKRIGSKKADAPKFEEVLPQLRAISQQEMMAKMIEEIKSKKAKNIEVRDFSGKADTPLKSPARVPAAAGA